MSIASPQTGSPRQHTQPEEICHGENYSVVRLGPISSLLRYKVDSPRGGVFPGKVFLHDFLGLSGMEISFGLMPARAAVPFYHKHDQNEEVYLFLKGRGQIQIDGETIDVSEGTAVRVAPGGVRAWRNVSDEELFYLVIQAREGSLEKWRTNDGVGVPGTVEWPT